MGKVILQIVWGGHDTTVSIARELLADKKDAPLGQIQRALEEICEKTGACFTAINSDEKTITVTPVYPFFESDKISTAKERMNLTRNVIGLMSFFNDIPGTWQGLQTTSQRCPNSEARAN